MQNAALVEHPRRGIAEGVVASLPIAISERRLVGKIQPPDRGGTRKTVRDYPRLEEGTHATSENQAMEHDYANHETASPLSRTVTPGGRLVYILI
jgi:hypothetical protein